MKANSITRTPTGHVEVEASTPTGPTVGQWYWVRVADDKERWLGCVVKLGSNYAEVEGADHSIQRIHLDEFDAICHRESSGVLGEDNELRCLNG